MLASYPVFKVSWVRMVETHFLSLTSGNYTSKGFQITLKNDYFHASYHVLQVGVVLFKETRSLIML